MLQQNTKNFILGGWIAAIVLLPLAIFILDRAHSTPTSIPAPVIPPAVAAPTSGQPDAWWVEVLQHAAGPVRGSANAPFTIVEFGDFQCPMCGRVRPKIENVVDNGIANLYFIQCPLPMHKYALGAAEAADSASAQGRFWQMYDQLYEHQSDLRPEMFKGYAEAIGIDGAQVESDVRSKKYAQQIAVSLDLCKKLEVSGTPSIIVRNNSTDRYSPVAGAEVGKLLARMETMGHR